MAKQFDGALKLMSKNQLSFVLVNSSPDRYEPCYNGLYFPVPGREEVFDKPKVSTFMSYLDPVSKAYIPGTLMIHDIHKQGVGGAEELVWNSRTAARHVLGVVESASGKFTYEGAFGMAGISVVLEGATAEEIEEVRKNGLERYKEYELARAMVTVNAHESRNAVRAKHGLDPIPPGDDYADAIEIVGALQDRRRKRLLAKFDLEPLDRSAAAETTKAVPEAAPKPVVPAVTTKRVGA